MHLEIVTPEEVLLSGEVNSVSVPGVMGSFQMLDGHAPIVSLLEEGEVKVNVGTKLENFSEDKFSRDKENNLKINIKGGVVEMKDNKTIVLVD
jgi:F-type H+-transporting ATPase subunit epsilon